MRRILLALLAATLAPATLASSPAHAQADAATYRIDPAHSRLYVVVRRTGLFAFLGHDHAILAHDWAGELCWRAAARTGEDGWVSVDARTLTIDADSARELAGLGDGPFESQVRSIQEKLLDDRHLAAERYPTLRLDSIRVSAAGDGRGEAEGVLTIRGVARTVRFPVVAEEGAGDTVHFVGRLEIRQSDYDIRPESIIGVVRVADPVELRFDAAAQRTDAPCG